MPKRKLLKCYFGCPNDGGMFHRFPSTNTYRLEYQLAKDRYDHWKSVLDKDTIEKGDDYIRHSIFICYKHFEDRYKTPNGLVRNAIPTLQIERWDPDKEQEYNKLLKSEDSEPDCTETLIDDDYLSTSTAENERWDPDKEQEYNKLLKSEDSEPDCTETLIDDDYLSTSTAENEPWDPDKEQEYNKILKSEDPEPDCTETLLDDDHLSTTTIENDNTHLKNQKTITRLKSKLADLRNKYKIQRNKIREVKRLSRNKYLSNLLFSCSWCRRLNKIVNGRICKFNRQFVINKSKNIKNNKK